jgi:AcrR family transcriptional regulator
MTEPEPGTQRDRGKAQRRKALLDAARAMIREGDTIGFAMRALAQRAGVGEVTPYNLFGSKRGVLEGILSEEMAGFQAEFDKAPAADELDAIFRLITVSVDMYRGDPQLYRVVFRDLMMTGDSSLRSFFSGPQREFFTRLMEDAVRAGLLTDVVQPRLAVRTLARVFTSAIADWLWEGISLESLEANVGLGFAMILRGMATPAAAERCNALMIDYQRAVVHHSRKSSASIARAGKTP